MLPALLTLVTGFVAGPLRSSPTAPAMRPGAQPRMLVELAQVDMQSLVIAKQTALPSALNVPDSQYSLPSSMNVAAAALRKSLKSEGDEILDELLVFFPVFMGGGSITAFVVEYIKRLAAAGAPEFLPEGLTDNQFFALAAVVLGSGFFVVLTKTGILATATGLLAKTSLDIWNLFAGVVLKGAILKY